jgi:hypothetical protein
MFFFVAATLGIVTLQSKQMLGVVLGEDSNFCGQCPSWVVLQLIGFAGTDLDNQSLFFRMPAELGWWLSYQCFEWYI